MRNLTRKFFNKMDADIRSRVLNAANASSGSDTGLKLIARNAKDVTSRRRTDAAKRRIVNGPDEDDMDEDDDTECAELLMFGTIGDSWWGECITGREVNDFCRENRGIPIKMLVDSEGGDVYDGMVIMNSLMFHDAEVTGEIMGLCYSAASYAVLGCDKVKAHQTSNFGIHPASMFTWGNQYQHIESIKWLDSIDRMLIDVYAARTGMTTEEVKALFVGNAQDGTIFTAIEAKDKGFVDEIIELPKREKQSDRSPKSPTDQAPSPPSAADPQSPSNDIAATRIKNANDAARVRMKHKVFQNRLARR